MSTRHRRRFTHVDPACEWHNGQEHAPWRTFTGVVAAYIRDYRVRTQVLNEAVSVLCHSALEIERCRDFERLMRLVEEKLRHLSGLGELTRYDIAHRICAYLDLSPKKVYLHRGTRDGAKALGIDGKLASIDTSMLPREFLRLKPSEIEDCLCIFKSELGELARGKPKRNFTNCG